jgi:periplasmic protein TonB
MSWLQAHKTYPEAARRDGVEGRVVVRFVVDGGGEVQEVSILHSSGSALLDEAAIGLLRGAHLPRPPPAPGGISLTLPIRYSLTP